MTNSIQTVRGAFLYPYKQPITWVVIILASIVACSGFPIVGVGIAVAGSMVVYRGAFDANPAASDTDRRLYTERQYERWPNIRLNRTKDTKRRKQRPRT